MCDSFEFCRWCGTSSYIATQPNSPGGRLLQATSLDATPLLIAVGGAECLHKRRIKVFHQLDIWATQEQYVKLLSFCITLSYLTTRQSLIGHSGWALPHYTGMGHCSCSFLGNASPGWGSNLRPLVPMALKISGHKGIGLSFWMFRYSND